VREDQRQRDHRPGVLGPGDIKYTSGFKAVFTVSELGFVNDLKLPDELSPEAKARFFEVLSSVKFLPELKNGKSVDSKVAIRID
jgi:hypothetical protein